MKDVIQKIKNIGIIPVIAIEEAEKAIPLAKALVKGGLPAAEITFRTAAGEEAIRYISSQVPEILVGAGTILNVEQCQRAIAAGAKFIVSPGYQTEVVTFCKKQGIVVLPGCVNASDMTRAVNDGLEFVKFFPAEQSGGIQGIKALAPVFPNLKFMPTGSINTKNLLEYLSYDRIYACGGTWMVKKELIEAEQWDEIANICQNAVKTMLGFELAHVGITCSAKEEVEQITKTLCTIFDFPYYAGRSSSFAGSVVECSSFSNHGLKGHIAIATNHVDRAIYQLGLKGVSFDLSSRKLDTKGNTKAIYFKQEFGGFAIHLLQK